MTQLTFLRQPLRRVRLVNPVCAGLLALACSDDDVTAAGVATGRYVIATTLFQVDGETSLVTLVDDPGAATSLDTTRAREVGGAAAIFGEDGRSVFALGSSDGPVLTRYAVNAGGELIEGARLSLQQTGIPSAFKRPELVPFVSQTKAYWLDDVTAQVIVWNPSEMTLAGQFSVDAALRDGFDLEFGEAVLRDGLLFVSAQYRSESVPEAGQAVALVIDTTTDTLLDVITDDRCGGTVDVARGADGALYFASDALAASLHVLQRPAGYPQPCILRIAPGEQRFDSGYHVPIPSLVQGRAAGRLVAGAEGAAYVLALHEELLDAPLGPDTDLYAPWDSAAWRWWKVELGQDTPGALLEGIPVGSAASRVLHAGGRAFISQANASTGRTTLLVPQSDGTLTPGLDMAGYPYGLLALDVSGK